MGAAGRDFHNFNVFFRNNPEYEVVAFTATQIPNIENRKYPPELAGAKYPNGIDIFPESELSKIIREKNVDLVCFSYSDVSHEYVMHKASQVLAAGASFLLLGPKDTMLRSSKPVISVVASRTGSGKSTTTRKVAKILKSLGKKVVIVRHPMPYGDLRLQILQRFEKFEDLDRYRCTLEEREEYEPHLEDGNIVYSGVDYEKVIRAAEKEADILIWDGGNNDFPFVFSDILITLVDPTRPGHELLYYPGEVNVRMADIIVISKVNSVPQEIVRKTIENVKLLNKNAEIIEADLALKVDRPDLISGKVVITVDDAPTLTHGELEYGAGYLAAIKYGASKILDPVQYALGEVKDIIEKYNHPVKSLPSLGYSENEIRDLERTLNSCPADVIVSGASVNLSRLLKLNKPLVQVRYELREVKGSLEEAIRRELVNIQEKKKKLEMSSPP